MPSISKMNKADLYNTLQITLTKNNELETELDNLKSILKITGQGEFSPAIFDTEYQELLKKKLEFQDKYNELYKKFNPDKTLMNIKEKEINRLKDKLSKLENIEEQYDDNKMRLNKLAEHHKRLSDNHEKLIIANKTLIENNEDLKHKYKYGTQGKDGDYVELIKKGNSYYNNSVAMELSKLEDYKRKIFDIYSNDPTCAPNDWDNGMWSGCLKMLQNKNERSEKLRARVQELEQELSYTDSMSDSLDTMVKSLDTGKRKIKKENEKLIKENKLLSEKVADLNEKIDSSWDELVEAEIKPLKDTIYEKVEEIKELHKKLKHEEQVGERVDKRHIHKINTLQNKVNYYKTKHDLLYKYFNIQEPQ